MQNVHTHTCTYFHVEMNNHNAINNFNKKKIFSFNEKGDAYTIQSNITTILPFYTKHLYAALGVHLTHFVQLNSIFLCICLQFANLH